MANRAYLYATNEIPSEKKATDITGLSEWPGKIPFSYLLLISGNPVLCKSLIFASDEKIAIVGAFDIGVETFKKALELIKNNGVELPEEFDKQVRWTLDFLSEEKNIRKYILLEPHEIFWLTGSKLTEETVMKYANLAKYLSACVEKGNFAILNQFSQGKLLKNWKDELPLGMDCWSNVLYYDLRSSS